MTRLCWQAAARLLISGPLWDSACPTRRAGPRWCPNVSSASTSPLSPVSHYCLHLVSLTGPAGFPVNLPPSGQHYREENCSSFVSNPEPFVKTPDWFLSTHIYTDFHSSSRHICKPRSVLISSFPCRPRKLTTDRHPGTVRRIVENLSKKFAITI